MIVETCMSTHMLTNMNMLIKYFHQDNYICQQICWRLCVASATGTSAHDGGHGLLSAVTPCTQIMQRSAAVTCVRKWYAINSRKVDFAKPMNPVWQININESACFFIKRARHMAEAVPCNIFQIIFVKRTSALKTIRGQHEDIGFSKCVGKQCPQTLLVA